MAAATRTTRGRTSRTGSPSTCRTTSSCRTNLTLNLGLRWAYTSPLVEKDNRQANFDVNPPYGGGTGLEILAKDGSIEDRALYKPFYGGWEPRVGFAWRPTDRWVLRGGYGISQYMEGTGSNLRLPMNPPFFFESNVVYDKSTGPGTITTGFAELVPGTTPSGNVRAFDQNLRPQFTQQWNVFVERQLTQSCRSTSATSATTPRTSWRRSRATSRCPARATRPRGPRSPSAARSTRCSP